MISQIYSIDEPTPKLDLLPDDVHGIICEYLDKEHEFVAWSMINEKINLIPHDIKLYACNNCSPIFEEYKNDCDFENKKFLKLVAENLHNIVEARKIIPLFYKQSRYSDICVNVDEHIKINKILTEGYTIKYEEKYCTHFDVYKLNNRPIAMNIEPLHVLIAYLVTPLKFHICYDYTRRFIDIKFQAYYREPPKDKLERFVRKFKKKNRL